MAFTGASNQKLTTPQNAAASVFQMFDTLHRPGYMYHMYDTVGVSMTNSPTPSSPPWRLLTTVEVAEILRVSSPTVRRLKKNGDLDAVAGLRTLRFSTATVDAFLNRKRTP